MKFRDSDVGIYLIAETDKEKEMLKRYYEGGVKANSITGNHTQLHLTFADLIED